MWRERPALGKKRQMKISTIHGTGSAAFPVMVLRLSLYPQHRSRPLHLLSVLQKQQHEASSAGRRRTAIRERGVKFTCIGSK